MALPRNSLLLISALLLFASLTPAQKLKPDEIVAKHLDSIGKKEVRDAVKTLLVMGTSSFESVSPAAKGGGRAVVVSDEKNLMFALSFNSPDYPFEKIGYFDTKVSIPYVDSGKRSLLGSFLTEHSSIINSGLFGGVLSLRWPLLGLDGKKPGVLSSGTQKIANRDCYVLSFVPPNGGSSELSIRLYFDAETFRHVRSNYRREIPAGFQTFGQQNQAGTSIIELTEDFSDFRTVDGLTLPFAYKADFRSNSNAAAYENIWGMKLSDYSINQKLAPDFFTFDK